ncbi:MAG: DUF58 domain-containing protein [Actinomycetota bacterium]|nr:DUF58 domain-containing protein [Actinomycetota bacterium]
MTRSGRIALALGVLLYVAAWAFGSQPLYPVAVGLLLANPVAWACVRLADRPLLLHRKTLKDQHFEGENVEVEVELEGQRRLPTASVTLVETIEKVGRRVTPLDAGGGGRRRARYLLRSLPRGRYGFPDARAVLQDPFGLQRTEISLPGTAALLVFPRIAPLERLFSEGGAGAQSGRRLLLRRPVGYDIHGVREYEQGESLRRVHWPTTARRGQLMVKELEDSPSDEIAVVLDAQAAAHAGTPPDSSFDLQVRAAASLLHAQARRGRRAVLLVNGMPEQLVRVHSLEGEWGGALETLAAAEPAGARSVAALLADEAGPAARARELALVTATLSAPLVDRLVQRAVARAGVSLVYVDAASFNGRARHGERPPHAPLLLRLQSAGIPVAVLRRGDDLAAILGAPGIAANGSGEANAG